MVSKKSSRGPVSKISSAASPAAGSAAHTASKSSVLRSAFSPSEFQLALFASVIQGFDAQHLRIHDTNTGLLRCEHAVNPKEVVTSLDWGYYGDRDQHSKKKRKRNSGVNGAADAGSAVVAFGTSTSEIRLYSPAEDKIVATLAGGHERGIKDFKFTANTSNAEGWSIGGDGKLVQWDIASGKSLRVITLPTTSVSALATPVPSNPPVLCASQTPYIIDIEKRGADAVVSFNAMNNPIHSLVSSSSDHSSLSDHFLAVDAERYMNVFDSQKRKIQATLVADKEIESVSFYSATNAPESTSSQKQVVAAVTSDGTVELFARPFYQAEEPKSSATSLKAQRQKMTRRADAVVRIVRPDKTSSVVPVVSASLQGAYMVVAWAEGGVNLVFERIKWQDEDTLELAIQGTKEVVRTKSSSVLGSAVTNGAKNIGKSHVDESQAVVQGGAEDIDMEEANQSEDSEPSEAEELSGDENETSASAEKKGQKQRQKDDDTDMKDAEGSVVEEEEEEGAEPSFGELVRVNAAEPIDVEAGLDDTGATPLRPSKNTALQLPSGMSLATVLAQSLKTNDNTMLESCFHTTNVDIVRATIQRMDSSLAAKLLQKLAERLSSRPGRYGHLLVWVQWTCVAHGGAIAGKAEILKKMTSLFKVMDQRSASLPSLLLLKGKLDMLDAQMGLRQAIQNRSGGVDSDDEDNVIYVEGQDDGESDDENAGADTPAPRRKAVRDIRHTFGSDEEDDEAMPNGVATGSEDEVDGSDDEELVDVEAEESDDGSSDAEESMGGDDDDHDEDDHDEEDAGSLVDFIADSEEDVDDLSAIDEPAPPPSKKAKLHKGKKPNGARK